MWLVGSGTEQNKSFLIEQQTAHFCVPHGRSKLSVKLAKMLSFKWAWNQLAVLGISVGCLVGAYFYATTPHRTFAEPESAEALLSRADELSWGNRWAEARPIYERAARLFSVRHNATAER